VRNDLQNIGKQWVINLPKHWKADRIKDVCENVVGGGTPKSSISEYWDDGEIIWISPTDFSKQKGERLITESEKKITQLGMEKSSATLIPEGTVVMSSRASIGEPKIAAKEITTNQGFISFIAGHKVHNLFLFYCIEGQLGEYFAKIASGTTFMEISRRMAKQELIPLPPLPEQKAIADYLDKACARIDRIIAIKEEQLRKIDSMLYSAIYRACTKGIKKPTHYSEADIGHIKSYPSHWQIKKIKRGCFHIDTGGTPKSSEPEYFENGTIEWYAPECIGEGLDISTPKKMVNIKALEDNEIKLYPENSVFFVGVGATAGKVGVVKKPSSCNQQINILQTNYKLIPEFLAYQLKILEKEVIKFAQYTTLPILNQAKTGAVLITFPPRDEQLEIVEYLNNYSDKLSLTKDKIREQIKKVKKYRKSLIHECLTGKKQVYTGELKTKKEVHA
jgi:type I restriction enzyme S subunit